MTMPQILTREGKVYIYTLGKFFIRLGDTILSENTSRSKKMWEVFKYLLSNRDKSLFPETILGNIWPEKDYADPSTVMRAQMFRLRQALNNDHSSPSLAANIVFSQGCYHWEDKVDYWIDVDEFEKLANRARLQAGKNQEEAIEIYNQAIKHYAGDYLPESAFSEWITPLRSHYHNIYLSCVFDLADLLIRNHAYKEIIKLCEQALSIDYFEEKIHIRLIEALLAEGLTVRARVHYNEATSTFYREMGIKPSDAMKRLYRLVGMETGSFELDLNTIQEGLKGKDIVNGAYLCDAELFRYFYKLERLRGERSGQSVLLCLMTLVTQDYSKPLANTLREVMQSLQDVIMDSLRKGDLVTRWNEAQFLLMLPGLNREQAALVMERIEKSFSSHHSLKGLKLHKKVESLFPLESDAHFS